jgi:aspartyl-tRNA(Asn)/glutamyl-tRNA(Gln) amidotransferase subunit A
MTDAARPTSEQRLDETFARIRDPKLEGGKVFTTLYETSARREAEASDARVAAGKAIGPLDGRIVSIKDLFDVAGEPTRAGSALLRRQPPATADAPVVRRLRVAGAVIVGKTQMTEFAFSALGTNPHHPVAGNPHDRSRAPGGSSSGAVVSLVDGMAEIAIGSDTGGSIRIPSALSGAVGFKPTSGRVPTTGAFSLSSTLDTIGPIAHTIADCAITDAVLSGTSQPALAPQTPGRLIVARGRLFDDIEPAVTEAFETGLERLRAAGLMIEDGSLEPTLDRLAEIDKIGGFPSIELGATLRDLNITSLDEVDPKTRTRIEAGAGILGVDYVRMQRRRAATVQTFEAGMSDDTVYLLPTTPIQAPLLSSVADDAGFHCANGLVLRNPRVGNLLDTPSVSLPLPVPAGALPVGLMLIGRRGADRMLQAIAARLEAALAV